jgi:hypothetical protein
MGQLRALVGLRWRMVRSPRARAGLIGLLVALLVLLAGGVAVGQSLPGSVELRRIILLTPTFFVVFAVLTVVAPLVAGGGNELYPEGQLVAYPIEPRTVYAGSLLVAPLNLAWITQVIVLFTTTAIVAEQDAKVGLALLTTFAFVVTCTVVGQSIAWAVVGLRQRVRGRNVSRLLAGALFVASLVVFTTGHTRDVLDASPTERVVLAASAGSQGRYGRWATTTAVLVLIAYVAARLGRLACAWAVRRTAPVGRPELKPVERRGPRRGRLAELTAVDRASVWRSTSLRRGTLVLAVLPGSVSMLAHPTWSSLALLPGLVAAGAGLLFGVNAFCLDGSGAMFVASQPHDPRDTLVAKLLVTMQTCLAAVVLAVTLAATQVRHAPSAAELVAVLGSVVGSSLLVVAACGRMSVGSPHKADLRGPRDTPAPPATMAIYSMRLALGTTWAGLAFAGAGGSGSVVAALAACVAVLCVGTRSLLRTLERWSSPLQRAHVVTTVSYG